MSDLTGRLSAVLADRYLIERELGQGGMATVFLAADLKHERKVAIKVLKPDLAAVLGADRFVQEIATTAQLQHPNILPLFDSGSADGFLYYVMPYLEGETLRERRNRETQLGVEEAVRISVEIADALDYAHGRGVVHREESQLWIRDREHLQARPLAGTNDALQPLLEELEHGLTSDIDSMNVLLERYRGIDDRVSRLLDYMRTGGEYSDTLDASFGTAYAFQQFDLNRAGYESLKSQGLDLVTDAALRSEIAQVYEQDYPRIEESVLMERNVVLEVLRPYFLRHFRNLRFGQSAEPIDYRALLADDEFLNLLDYRRQAIAQNHIAHFTEAIPQLETLRTRIAEELTR